MRRRSARPESSTSAWPYFVLTLGWSGFFYSLAALVSQRWPAGPATLFHAIGGIGPALVAVVLLYRHGSVAARRDFWQRIVDFRRIPRRWYAIIFLLVPAATGLASLLDLALGGWGIRLEAATDFIDQPLAIVPFALFIMIFGPLPEEPGWRGYALDRLQTRHKALAASLILGTVWALWHLPLFFMQGSYQHSLGFGSLAFWLYTLSLLPDAILYTWIYNNTGRSTLSAILFHFMANFVGELFLLSPQTNVIRFLLWIVLAAAVVVHWGPATLSHNRPEVIPLATAAPQP